MTGLYVLRQFLNLKVFKLWRKTLPWERFLYFRLQAVSPGRLIIKIDNCTPKYVMVTLAHGVNKVNFSATFPLSMCF